MQAGISDPGEDFDLEDVFDERIYPLMAQVLEICKEAGMPMIAQFLYGRQGNVEWRASSSLLQPVGRRSVRLDMAARTLQMP